MIRLGPLAGGAPKPNHRKGIPMEAQKMSGLQPLTSAELSAHIFNGLAGPPRKKPFTTGVFGGLAFPPQIMPFGAGVFENMPPGEYRAAPGINQSALKQIARSPAHYQQSLLEPRDSKDMQLGRALHCLVLEPLEFGARFAFAPEVDRRTKDGKATFERFQASLQPGTEILSEDQGAAIEGMRAALELHPVAGEYLRAAGANEVSVFWRAEFPAERGDVAVECKGRLDRLLATNTIIDLKTTDDARPGAFNRRAAEMGHHIQAAYYVDGLAAAADLDVDPEFLIVAVEKTPPYGIACYCVEPETLQKGRDEYKRLLTIYDACIQSGNWPGYPPSILPLTLPPWA